MINFKVLIIIVIYLELPSVKSFTAYSHKEDQIHKGDLYFEIGPDILPLTWSVELNKKCSIDEVLDNTTHQWNAESIKNYNCLDIQGKLYLLRSLKHLDNVYVIAHSYFRMYNKFKRKSRRQYHRNILNKNALNYKIKFSYEDKSNLFLKIKKCVDAFLRKHKCVKYSSQEVLRQRDKRIHIEFPDPLFKDQWHLKNHARGGYDINVYGAWASGITGRGVTVCVIDDGLEWKHPDLQDNYDPRGSYDLTADDFDPSPVKNGDKNEHGTRCAGEIAAVTNSVCGVGVAYRANISGVRVLGERMTDSLEATAFVQGLHVNDIYSCSWGPNDDGKTIEGPHRLAQKSLIHGITYGRKGYGAIYVVASGNGGRNKDNCNFDGYANSVYTVTIGAVDSKGRMPYYAEECATILGVTPSSGSNGRAIVTTDWMGSSTSGCTWHHSGTSAAAPMAAAIIALALEMQPCLSWRDVQYLIALTSRKIDSKNSDWIRNKAGLYHSHQHGFGLLDATRMVSAAAVWESVPFHSYFKSALLSIEKIIPQAPENLILSHTIDRGMLEQYAVYILEFVQVYITLEHEYRGSLMINLTCPSGTTSVLATPRLNDNSTRGLQRWPFGSVRCWGEIPWGTYSIHIHSTSSKVLKGKVRSWQLLLHGTSLTQAQFLKRRKLVKDAAMGKVVHVNRSNLCHPPELHFPPFYAMPDKWMKLLGIVGCFLGFMVIYNVLEYTFCYDEEKKKFQQKLNDLSQSLSLQNRNQQRRKRTAETSLAPFDDTYYSLLEGGSPPSEPSHRTNVNIEESGALSPSLSCEADISSLDEETGSEEGFSSSRNTDDTLVPRDTDFSNTDITTTDFTSEPDEDKRLRDDL